MNARFGHPPGKQRHPNEDSLMADGIASLYPQPQSGSSTNALAMTPAQMIGAAQGVAQLRAFQSDQASRQATGRAFQGALNDDGSIDQGKLSTSLQHDPDAAYGMPETTQKMLTQASGQFNLDAARNKFLIDGLGSAANDPNISADKVRSLAVTMARNLKIPGAQVNNWIDGMPADKPGIRARLIEMRNIATGSAGLSTPTESGVNEEGAGITAPRDVYNYKTAGGGMPSGLAPGEGGLMESSAGRAAALQGTATTSPQYRADLANLKQMSKVLDIGGPTVTYEKKFGQLAQRFGLPSTLTLDQLKASEEFDKIANNIALSQGKALGGTDATRVLSVGSTPSSSMSRYGREGVISLLEGNQDYVDRAREQWLEARSNNTPASKHDQFMHSFGKNFDVRVFQFNRLDRANKQKFVDTLDRSEIPGFEQSYKNAAAHGWVDPLRTDK